MTTEKKQNQKKNTDVTKHEPSQSERFSLMVQREFSGRAGDVITISPFQKRLIQNYFISIDIALKGAEEKRLKKDAKYRDSLPVTWQNVNMEKLAIDVVALSRIGFDPALPNHINMVPYKNNTTQKYDIGVIEGYRGIELKAKKFGLDVPDDVIVEIVYSNDTFRPIKKDIKNSIESYEFTPSENPFDRGEIVGGFYYHVWKDVPEKNKLVWFTIAEIEKRKPAYASAEFWGGEKDIWKNGKKTGEKEKIEGWYPEMIYKTLYRAAYNSITIDSQKIDEDFMRLIQQSEMFSSHENQQEIDENANKEPINFIDAEDITGAQNESISPEKDQKASQNEPKQVENVPELSLTGPGF